LVKEENEGFEDKPHPKTPKTNTKGWVPGRSPTFEMFLVVRDVKRTQRHSETRKTEVFEAVSVAVGKQGQRLSKPISLVLCFCFEWRGTQKDQKKESFGDFWVVEMLVMAPVGFAQRCGLLYPRSIFRIFGSLSGGLKVIALHSPFFALQLNPICSENGARFDFAHFFWHPEAPEMESVA